MVNSSDIYRLQRQSLIEKIKFLKKKPQYINQILISFQSHHVVVITRNAIHASSYGCRQLKNTFQ